MEQLYIAVVDKERLPKTLQAGTVNISYEEAIAAGLIKQNLPTPKETGETPQQRMDRIVRESRQPKQAKPPMGTRRAVNAAEIVKEPRRRRRKHGDK